MIRYKKFEKENVLWSELSQINSSNVYFENKFCKKSWINLLHQISSFLRIWSHSLKISLQENLIFCTVWVDSVSLPLSSIYDHKPMLKNKAFVNVKWLHFIFNFSIFILKKLTQYSWNAFYLQNQWHFPKPTQSVP